MDDSAHGIEEVVRGDDLLPSTARQLLILRALGRRAPGSFAHLPLCLGPDGQRLGKRHGSLAVRALLDGGLSAPRLVGALASSLLELPDDERRSLERGVSPAEVLAVFTLDRVRRLPAVLDPSAPPLRP